MKGGKLGFGWVVLIVVASLITGAVVAWAAGFTSSQSVAVWDVYNNDIHATLRVKEITTDTLKGVEAGTTGSTDMNGYVQYATFLRVHEWDADTGAVLVSAQVSVDGSNWVTADTQTARTTDSTFYEIEWTLPPALYFRVIWLGTQNAVDSTLVDNIYHLFQQ